MRKKKILTMCAGGVILACGIASSSTVKADKSAVDDVSVTIPLSCTLQGVVATGEEHESSLVNGQHRDNIGKTTVTTYCNDSNGFDIYVVGASENQEGNTYLASSAGSNYNIPTGVYTNQTTTSVWGMKLDLVQGGTYNPTPVSGMFGSYMAVPSNWTKVAYRDANAEEMSMDPNTGGSSFTTTYEAYASATQPAGTYTGLVKYIVLHPDVPARPTLNTLEEVFDEVVGPSHKVTYNGKQYYRMQDMTASICAQADNIVYSDSQIQLLDDRTNADGTKRVYWVAKLKDDNCWMTQNLDLDWNAGKTFTHADTDLGWNGTIDTTASWTVGSGYGTISWNATNGKFTGWVDDNSHPYSADPGEKYYYTSNSTDADSIYSTMQQCLDANHTESDCEHYSAGNYYNWTSAIATDDSSGITDGNAPNSICPAGWRLPRTLSNEFAELLVDHNIVASIITNGSSTSYVTGGFNALRSAPLYFVRSGNVYGDSGALNSPAIDGGYYSSTAYSASHARYFYFGNDVLPASISQPRRTGRSVRCMAR